MPAILVAVFVGLPLLFVGTIFGAVYLASKGPRDRAHAFADAIHERKFEKARGMLVDDLQAEMSPAQFRKQMDDSHFSHGRDLSFHSFNIRNRQACFDGEVNGVLVNFRMEQVRGAWRIRSTERGNFCH